jgi:hypothetical protein
VKPGDRTPIPTVSEVVRRAVALTDPAGEDVAVRAFEESYEDDDRPATAAEDLAGELGSVAGGIDPEGDSPAISVAAAAAFWLSTNFGQADDREHVLVEATRLGLGDPPPPDVEEWLSGQGVRV